MVLVISIVAYLETYTQCRSKRRNVSQLMHACKKCWILSVSIIWHKRRVITIRPTIRASRVVLVASPKVPYITMWNFYHLHAKNSHQWIKAVKVGPFLSYLTWHISIKHFFIKEDGKLCSYRNDCLACLPTGFRYLGWTNLTRPFLATRSFLPSSGSHYCSTYNQKGTNN